ncbi:MAG: Flp pilus assembly protein CpaB [Desulfitobacteriaceae bacterium]
MMRRKGFLLLALICGLVAAGSIYVYLKGLNHTTIVETRPIVVTKAAIPARSVIQASQLEVRDVPRQGYPQGGISNIAALAGAVALVNLTPGDPVLASVLDRSQPGNVTGNSPTGGNSASLAVPAGKRAVAVPISLVSGVGFQVKPGDHVDVLATMDFKGPTGENQAITSLAAQDVLVLGTGESLNGDKNKVDAKAYVLALTVPQAMIVTLGSEKGTIRLLLRNAAEQELREEAPVSGSTFSGSNYFIRFK